MNRRLSFAVAITVGALGALPTLASAAVRVYAGPPSYAQSLVSPRFANAYNPDVNAFFRLDTTIHVGGTVSFIQNGFHTIDLPPVGGSDVPLITPGSTVSGVNDAAGNPFWFNGQVPNLNLNPSLLSRSTTHVYTGNQRLDSGLPLGPPSPFYVTFTKPGHYEFFCDVHPGMIGYIDVKPKADPIPTPAQNANAIRKQVRGDVDALYSLAKTPVPRDTVSLGQSDANGDELYAMFPATLTVPAKTVVTFDMSANSRETHTATFGPSAYLTTLANSFSSPSFDPRGAYPSDPTQPITLTPASHGNGFANTGVLDQDPDTVQIGPSSQIDFTTPGTYHFECLVHPFMQGTVVVK